MSKPTIGITCIPQTLDNSKINSFFVSEFTSISKAGGIPVILPVITEINILDKYSKIVDGIMFTGGHDVSPLEYKQEPSKYINQLTRDRDFMEIELFKKVYSKGKPILGICRGLQLINVALGGTLIQNIDSNIGHAPSDNIKNEHHTITLRRKSIIKSIYGLQEIKVNSSHHQAIERLGKDLLVTSRAKDNIIESIESANDKFILAVQYHPEDLESSNYNHFGLFEHFINEVKLNAG